MAAQKSEVVKSLETEVKCPLCMEIFTGPKKLPCDHVICVQCLGDLIKTSHNGLLTCPVCRSTTALRGPDAGQFPTAHQTNRLIDIYQKTLQEQLEASPAPKTASAEQAEVPMCPVHTSEALALYCETCEKSVCRDCALTSCAIKKHNYGFFKDMARKYEDELDREFRLVQKLQQDIVVALVDIKGRDEEQQKLKEEEEQKLDDAFHLFVSKILKEKYRIKQDIEERFNQQAHNNSSKAKELIKVLEETESNVKSVENLSMEKNPMKRFSKVTVIKKTLKTLCHQVESLTLELAPFEGLDVKLELKPDQFDASQFLYETKKEYSYLVTEYNMLKLRKVYERFKIDFHLSFTFDEAGIKSSFICLFDDSSTRVTVKKLQPKVIRLEFTPQRRGRHKLCIQLHDNTPICGSPISSFVYMDPEQISLLGLPSKTYISKASAIKCSDSQIYVTAAGEEIIILEHISGIFIGQHGLSTTRRIPMLGVNEVLIWDQYMYYSNSHTNKVEKLSKDGYIMHSSVGGLGTRPGFFKFPNGIRISRQNEIYVCDSRNHRIQVFDTDLHFLRVIGKEGSGPGMFLSPYDLVFDEKDNIYVVENGNSRVQVLSPQGDHIRFIGTSYLTRPVSAAIRNIYIYVTNPGRKNIRVFTLTGKLVASFGEGESLVPECIDIDAEGYIYVTSSRNSVVIY